MKILRRIGLIFAVALFSFFLWILAIDLGVVHFISHPASVKKVLADSGLYGTTINTVLEQKKGDGQPNTIKITTYEVATNDPIIKAAAVQAFPPEYIQQNVEQVIDSFNSWLSGDSTKPEFRVDLAQAKADFAKDVGEALQTKLTALPACTDGTTAATFNPFTATCLPKGVNATQTATAVQTNLASSKEFLDKTTYTSDDIKDANGQPVFAAAKVQSGKNRYNEIKSSAAFLIMLTVLTGLAVLFLSSTRRRGFRRIGVVMTLVGAFVLLMTALSNAAANHATVTTTDPNQKALQESALKAGRAVIKDVSHVYYPLGGIYAGVGIALIIGSLVIKPRGGKEPEAHEPTVHKPTILDDDHDGPHILDEPKAEHKPVVKPKPAAKPKPVHKPKPTVTKIKVS